MYKRMNFRVFVVFSAIFVLVSLNIFVVCLASCPKYVNVIHLLCSWLFVLELYRFVVLLLLLLLFSFLFMGLWILADEYR
jgi:hypothetical protein